MEHKIYSYSLGCIVTIQTSRKLCFLFDCVRDDNESNKRYQMTPLMKMSPSYVTMRRGVSLFLIIKTSFFYENKILLFI